jgi:hypothetical protein
MITQIFEIAGFIPHGHCYLWQTNLVGLHILSDGLIALAYYSIPIMLIYFVRQRQDTPFPESIFSVWRLHNCLWYNSSHGNLDALVSYLLAFGRT